MGAKTKTERSGNLRSICVKCQSRASPCSNALRWGNKGHLCTQSRNPYASLSLAPVGDLHIDCGGMASPIKGDSVSPSLSPHMPSSLVVSGRVGLQHSICSRKNWRNTPTSSTPEGLVEWISKDIWIPQNTITINDAHLVGIWLWGYFCLASMGHGSGMLPPSSSDYTEPKKSWRVIQEIPSHRKHRWWRKRRIWVRLGVGWKAVFLGQFRVTELLQHWWKLRTLYPEKCRHHTQTNMTTTSEGAIGLPWWCRG